MLKRILFGLTILSFVFLISCGSGGSGNEVTVDTNQSQPISYNQPSTQPEVELYRDVTLAWQANTETILAGYRVFMRTEGTSYDFENPEWETTDTNCTLYNLEKGQAYYFVVRAFGTDGSESGNSNEVMLDIAY